MPRRAFLPVVVACLVAVACSPSGAPSSGAATFDVGVDATSPAFNFQSTSYFPNDRKAHPGDTVRFTMLDRGEQHTVTFGTLVDQALAKIPPGPPVPTLEPFGLPDLIGGQPPQLSVTQSAAQHCFLASGVVP